MAGSVVCPQCRSNDVILLPQHPDRATCRSCGHEFSSSTAAVAGTTDPGGDAGSIEAGSLIGRRLDHFEVLELLGAGGMGRVYKARDAVLGRMVAVKVLPELLAAMGKSRIKRFLREARTAAGLNHPHVVTIHHIGQSAGHYYIVMELVEGGSVLQRLQGRGRFTPVEATRVVEQTAQALAAAHERGIIHRDIKPANLLFTRSDQVKVADFGLARLYQEASFVTQPGTVLGTPVYMAPELGRGGRATPGTDLYALGVTYYQLLTGRPPFQGQTPTAVIYQHQHSAVPDPTRFNDDLDGPVVAIVLRLLAKDPAQRYRRATELLADLGSLYPSPGSGASAGPTPPIVSGGTRPVRRARWTIGLASVLVAAGLGVTWLIWPKNEPTNPAEVPPPASPQPVSPVPAFSEPVSPPPLPATPEVSPDHPRLETLSAEELAAYLRKRIAQTRAKFPSHGKRRHRELADLLNRLKKLPAAERKRRLLWFIRRMQERRRSGKVFGRRPGTPPPGPGGRGRRTPR